MATVILAAVAPAAALALPAVAQQPVSASHRTATRIEPAGLAKTAEVALRQLQVYNETGRPSEWAAYESTRATVATEVGSELSIDARRLVAAWDAADSSHQIALMAAMSQLGTPYRRNTSSPRVGFDCSGLTTYAWGVAGVTLSPQSGAQIRASSPRSPTTAMAGDLVQYPGHVMLYLGVDRAVVQAVQPGRPVEVALMSPRRALRFGHPS